MQLIPEQIESYKCIECGKLFPDEYHAMQCMYHHIKERMIALDWKRSTSLGWMNKKYGFMWTLTQDQEKITSDSCFVISYLQCCDKPAYQITGISYGGKITVAGKGSWSGYYSSNVTLDNLKNPRPKDELFIDPR